VDNDTDYRFLSEELRHEFIIYLMQLREKFDPNKRVINFLEVKDIDLYHYQNFDPKKSHGHKEQLFTKSNPYKFNSGLFEAWAAEQDPIKKGKLGQMEIFLNRNKWKRLTEDDFEIVKTLGQGGYGKVILVRRITNKE
jgi:hypothetical protein